MLLTLATAIMLARFTQAAPPTPAHPVEMQAARSGLMVEPPSVNFGVVAPGTKHVARFVLRNTSAEPLTIARAQPSCKCTDISDIVGKTIPPNGQLELSAALAVPKSPGEKDAKVMISLEGKPGLILAQMVADVTLPVRVDPSYIDLLKGAQAGVIRLSSVDGKPFTITAGGGRAPSLVGFNPATDAPRASYVMNWNASELSNGSLPQWWVVSTDRADCPQIPIRIRHESTGSRFDMERLARFWFPPESIVVAGVVKVDAPVILSTTIEHLNPAAQGRVTNPAWGDVTGISVPGGQGTAKLLSSTKRGENFVDISFEFTPLKGQSGPLYVPVLLQTASGVGPIFIAITVVP